MMMNLFWTSTILVLAGVTLVAGNVCDNSIYEKIGCYKRQDQLLPDLIVNDRDPTHANYSGNVIHWQEYGSYLHSLACRCSDKAFKNDYKFFAIGFYGECWAGRDLQMYNTVIRDFTRGSMECVNGQFWACENFSPAPCTGGANTEYIYQVLQDDEEE